MHTSPQAMKLTNAEYKFIDISHNNSSMIFRMAFTNKMYIQKKPCFLCGMQTRTARFRLPTCHQQTEVACKQAVLQQVGLKDVVGKPRLLGSVIRPA